MRVRVPLAFSALALVLALVAIMAAAACGGGDDGNTGRKDTPAATNENGGGSKTPVATSEGSNGGSGDAVDACQFVTQDEASAALGTGVGEGTREDTPPFYACTYETEGFDQLTVMVMVYPNAKDAEAAYQVVMKINDYPKIDGLGDRAYDTQPMGDVTAQKGKYEISVDILTADDAADFEVAKDLTKAALGRLP